MTIMGKKYELMKGKDIFLRKSKVMLLFISASLLLSACGSDKELKAEANKIVEAVERNDVNKVEEMLFGKQQELEADEELADFFATSEEEDVEGGIIAKIIEQDTVKVKKIKDDVIVYEITAPNLSNIFQDAQKEELTTDNFEDYIYTYIEDADKIKTQIAVSYSYENEIFSAEYTSEDFVNGLTGNLLSSYQDLINEVISEFSEGEGE